MRIPTSSYAADRELKFGALIGGGYPDAPPPLIQSGTDSYIDINSHEEYYFWWQIVGGSKGTSFNNEINQLSVSYGDEVGATSVWIENYPYSPYGTAMLGVCNFTQGLCIHFNIANVEEPGNTTEWIVEAPSNSNVLPLAKFSSVTLNNSCWAAETGGLVVTPSGVVTPVGGSSSGTVNCQSITSGNSLAALDLAQNVLSGLQVLASPGPISANGTSFTVTYYQPH